MDEKGIMIPVERIKPSIVFIRDEKVMLDRDLAELYGVEIGALNRAVKRNTERFPEDFMFQVTGGEEAEVLRCQTGISMRNGVYVWPLLLISQDSRGHRSLRIKIKNQKKY